MKECWEIKKLGEVSEYFNGLTYSPKDVSDNGTIVLRSSNIQNDELDFSDIVRVNVRIKEKLFVKEGDILMCSRNGSQRLVGKTAPILNLKEPMTFGTFMMIIRSEFSPYLLWFFKTDEFKKQISGGENTMINQVTRYMLDEIKIPLPPLTEQQRIVAILDECFVALEKAKVNAEQNLKNAKELFESYLQGVFEKKGEGWEEKTLGDVCSLFQGIAINAKTKHALVEKSDLPLLRIKDLKNNTIEQYIDPNNFPKNALVTEDDIIYTRTGSLGLVFTGKYGVLHNNSFKVVPNKQLDKDFLFIWLQNPIFKSKIMELALKAAQPDITHAIFKIQEISIPPLQDQHTIVRQLDALRAETQRLAAVYQQKLADLEELKKSILQKAFAGELKTEVEVRL